MPQYNKATQTFGERNNNLFEVLMLSDKSGNVINPILKEDTLIKLDNSLGLSIVNKFGRNPVIDTTSIPEDIWEVGGLYTGQPTTGTAETITITSDSASDDGATVLIYGLDANYNEISETVTLVGGVGVSTAETTLTFWRSYRARVITPATGQTSNVGALTATMTTTTGVVFWSIVAGSGQTNVAAYTIPAGQTGHIKRYRAELIDGNTNAATIAFVVREFGQATRFIEPAAVGNLSSLDIDIYGSIDLPEKTDLIVRVINLVNNGADITSKFDILLSDNAVYPVV